MCYGDISSNGNKKYSLVTWCFGNWDAFQWFEPRLHENSFISVLRYWRPGPQDSFFKQRYFNFGFLYLQDLIDRALMNILLNETIEEPGVYMQEFPYPCYVKDKWVYRNLQVIIDCRRRFSLESFKTTGKYHSEVKRVLWFKKKKRIKWKTLALCLVAIFSL